LEEFHQLEMQKRDEELQKRVELGQFRERRAPARGLDTMMLGLDGLTRWEARLLKRKMHAENIDGEFKSSPLVSSVFLDDSDIDSESFHSSDMSEFDPRELDLEPLEDEENLEDMDEEDRAG
jgi:hypothetical protein